MEKYRDTSKNYCPNVFVKNLESKYFNYFDNEPRYCGYREETYNDETDEIDFA